MQCLCIFYLFCICCIAEIHFVVVYKFQWIVVICWRFQVSQMMLQFQLRRNVCAGSANIYLIRNKYLRYKYFRKIIFKIKAYYNKNLFLILFHFFHKIKKQTTILKVTVKSFSFASLPFWGTEGPQLGICLFHFYLANGVWRIL